MTPAGIGFLVDGLDRHHPHQPLDPFAVHRPAVAPQHRRQPPRAIERPRQMQLVHPPHHRQVVLAHWRRPVIQCRARHLQQPAPAFAGAGYCATTGRAGSSWSTSASRSGRVIAQTFCEKNPAPPSAGRSSHTAAPSRPRPPPRRPSRWRGSARTARPCHPAASSSTHGSGWHAPRNRLDSSATVPSSRTAASATFALKSAPCRFRVLVMSHLRPDGRSKGRRSLSYTVQFPGSTSNVVKLTFAKGASLKDPARLFNSSLDGNTRRAIDIHEGEEVDESAFKALIGQAAALNSPA